MSDPRRLLETATERADPVRRALEAAHAARPIDQLTQEVWTALSAKLPLAPNGSGTPPAADQGGGPFGASAATGGGSLAGGAAITATMVGKAIGAGMLLGALVSGGALAVAQDPPDSSAPMTSTSLRQPSIGTPSRDTPRPPAPVAFTAPARRDEPPPIRSARTHSPAAAPHGATATEARAVNAEAAETIAPALSPPVSRASEPGASPRRSLQPGGVAPSLQHDESAGDVIEEGLLLGRARDALRRGNAERALALLEGMGKRFARGRLVQEREVLLIEALFVTKRTTFARERASHFLRDHPESAHVTRVRAFLR